MTFLQVVNIIRDTALAQPNVNTVVREFLDLNREDTKYSAVVIQDRDGLRDRIVEQDWNTYTFHLGYVDRLTFDEKNRDDIFSTGINVINNIVSSIRERWDLEVSIIDRFSTFNQRFTASCAGVYVVLAIQVPISDCVDTEETNIYDKLSIDITNNGHYHYVPDGRPYGDIDIVVNVENQKPEDSLDETITSNGSYNYVPEEGRVFNEVDITVDVPGKPEESLVDTITSNGSYHYDPSAGSVFSGADITVSVPVKQEGGLMVNSYYNGTETLYAPSGMVYNVVTINTDVHPSTSLSETYTSNGSYNISGEFNGGVVTVSVPSDQKPEQVGHFEVTDWGTSYLFYPDPGYVLTEVEVMNATPVRTYTSTVTSNGSLRWSAGEGGSLISMLDISVDVHPSQSLAETITSNGSYHYTGEWNGADITVAVPIPRIYPAGLARVSDNGRYGWLATEGEAWNEFSVDVNVHPSQSLVETITSNGSYHYNGEYAGADITVSVSAEKPEESLVETISSNGSYSFSPTSGYVFSDASIAVDVHPSNSLSRTYTTNGTKTINGEFNGGTVNVNVHPSASLVETITSNGSYSYPGEYAGAAITVAVERYANTLRISQTAYNNLSVKDPDTIYLIYY